MFLFYAIVLVSVKVLIRFFFVCFQFMHSVLPLPSSLLSFCMPLQTGFYKGVAGSQVTLSSLVNQSRAMLEEQARHLLTEHERQTMNYYIQEYRSGHIGVEQLVMALFELLNTHAKVCLCERLLLIVLNLQSSSNTS